MVKTYQSKAPGIRNVSSVLAILGVLASLGALVFIRFYMNRTVDSYTEKSLSEFSSYASAIERSDETVLFEGLPSPSSEPDLYMVESVRPDFRAYADLSKGEELSLYAQPMGIGDLEKMQLSNLLTNPRYIEKSGYKRNSAPFHADYGVQFETRETTPILVFINLSGEELLFTGGPQKLACKLTEEGASELRFVLRPWIKNRPSPEHRTFFQQAIELNENGGLNDD
ncbi:hypothetical protein [Pelagicoccus albus]|uniref:Uncharacterized protein n=1 Tax=Pelagicoccus albus TaxID=415222 RepID=A0A7X1B3U2_9BACT|nr:hypothetical protein [Pelagicoccus albus]MBC2604914.1 hypothetical protein [Pelagicoccus albus]